jgi:hypothetical protein
LVPKQVDEAIIVDTEWQTDPFLRAKTRKVSFTQERIVFVGYAPGPGRAADFLQQSGPGIIAAGLGTPDIDRTRGYLARQELPLAETGAGDEVASGRLWLEPKGELGVYLLFEQGRE